MKIWLKKIIFILLLIFGNVAGNAQVKDSMQTGRVTGMAKDSSLKFMLVSATIAVYRVKDSTLLQYTLPNNFGEFILTSLPLKENLRLTVTHIGYKEFSRNFIIPEDTKYFEFGVLYLNQVDDAYLNEVVVRSIVPVRMNGDTLEFNADAFRLDSNATTEDLVRKLPGMTIWGDGEITFRGKKIQTVLVDGKPFMGGGNIVSVTQNLPKSTVDKIQVFQQRDEKNPLDSTLYANIKLKEGKKSGHFGKGSLGVGTGEHFALDAAISGFSKKLQFSSVGAWNNINKIAENADVLLNNSTFKGESLNFNYQPDFLLKGINKPVAAGLKFQYDFIPNPNYLNTSRFTGDYFLKRNNTFSLDSSTIITFLKTDSLLTRNSVTRNNAVSSSHVVNSHYTRNTVLQDYEVKASYSNSYNENNITSVSNLVSSGTGIVSNMESEIKNITDSKVFEAGVKFTNRDNWGLINRIPSDLSIGYDFSLSKNTGNGKLLSKYYTVFSPSDNKFFDRIYRQRDEITTNHTLTTVYPSLRRLIFNKRNFGGIDMGLSNVLVFSFINSKQSVLDFDSFANNYVDNSVLSNSQEAFIRNMISAFNVSKIFYKGLTTRYSKNVAVKLSFRNQYYHFENNSTQYFQNIKLKFNRFIPSGSLTYQNHQYGNYEISYVFSGDTKVNYPLLNQLAPLIDSSNLWFIQMGNRYIKPEYEKNISFGINYATRKTKNPAIIKLLLEHNRTDDKIIDSLVYDNTGKTLIFLKNTNDYTSLKSLLSYQKSLMINKFSTLEFYTSYGMLRSKRPQFIGNIFNVSNNRYNNFEIVVGFRHKELFNSRIEQNIFIYKATQTGFGNSEFTSNNSYTRFVAILQYPRHLIWSSYITYNRSFAMNHRSINYTIWNAAITYRFRKNEDCELKISALDLLSQNKGVINTSEGNIQTFGYGNVLRQYFMLTFSFYPRKFGK